MSQRPPKVSSTGDIFIHISEDLAVTINPAAGSYSGKSIFFEIPGTAISVATSASGIGKLISVPVATFDGLDPTVEFAVVDRTGGAAKTLWSGKLVRYR